MRSDKDANLPLGNAPLSTRVGAGSRKPVILVCEDEPLLAIDLEDDLLSAGAEVSGPVSSQRAALQQIAKRQPDAAILDIELDDGSCAALAEELRGRNVPFVIVSGLCRPDRCPPPFSDAPWLSKPLDGASLLGALSEVMARQRSASAPPE